MGGKLELTLLGNPAVYLNGESIKRFRSAKSQALLYYLAVERRIHPRSVLAGLFWGDAEDTYARRSLNSTLSNLRRLVGDYLTITRQTIAFDVESDYWLDVEVFEATGIEPEHLEKAVALYSGDFLEGFYIHDAPEFEQWVLTERARLRELALQALHALAGHYAAQGDLSQAIDTLRQMLNLEPWREEAHQLTMCFLAQNGQRSAALTQFEACRQVLADELAVEPGTETVELYNRIRHEEIVPKANVNRVEARIPSDPSPVPDKWIDERDKGVAVEGVTSLIPQQIAVRFPIEPRTPHHNLPIQPTPFIGREQELTDITTRLCDPDCRLLTLVGPGGIGKTRLALEAAQRLVDDTQHKEPFSNGVFFVALQPLNAASDIASAIAEAIHFRFYGDASLEQQLLNFLYAKQMLLVLDNFEHLLEGADLVSDILATAAGITILVTSREELGLQEAWFQPIAGMSFPKDSADLEVLDADFDAIQLFDQRARRAHATFSLTEEPKDVVQICQLVDGMPLGIELAAAWTRTLSCHEIVEEIERSLDFLSTSLRNVPERHRSLRVLFEQSWQRLSPTEQAVLRKMLVFRGSCIREAAEAVTDATLPLLASLVDKALVRRTRSGRYEMHELLRQFAMTQLQTSSNAYEQVQDRHCTYYASYVQGSIVAFKAGQQKEVLAAFTTDIDNIRSAWNHAIARRDWQALEQTAECFWLLGEYQGALQEGEALLQRAVTSFGTMSEQSTKAILTTEQEQLIGLLLAAQGYLCGRYKSEEGLALTKQGLSRIRQTNSPDMWKEAMALVYLGFVAFFQGKYREAREVGQESLALFSDIDDRWGMIQCYLLLGDCTQWGGAVQRGRTTLTSMSIDLSGDW
ncbi:AAA family ATPase [Chloroflexi bacterium TSY]|nr:AAA family ATPase [Chloroflexi bacterium TSY]